MSRRDRFGVFLASVVGIVALFAITLLTTLRLSMNDSELRKKMIEAATADAMTSKFIDEIGNKAHVTRETMSNDRIEELRAVIADVGADLQTIKAVPETMKYRGSLCIHVYTSAVLKTAAFATTNVPGTMDAALADGALRELTGSTMEKFGAKRKKLRSGF